MYNWVEEKNSDGGSQFLIKEFSDSYAGIIKSINCGNEGEKLE